MHPLLQQEMFQPAPFGYAALNRKHGRRPNPGLHDNTKRKDITSEELIFSFGTNSVNKKLWKSVSKSLSSLFTCHHLLPICLQESDKGLTSQGF